MKERAARFGRAPDQLRVIPGLFVVVGGTEAEAHRKLKDASESVDMPTAKQFLNLSFPGVDLVSLPDDEPPPRTPEFLAAAAAAKFVLEKNGRPLTLREMCTAYGNHHRLLEIVGTPEQIADMMEVWLKADAADGFNMSPLTLPDGYEDFVDEVVPLLQKRGVYREAYEGKTLRENLGFQRPDLVSA
jgi:alkanesulfonate monooxygenase SsuD/methylene tetrahydromethanopterin reductase-like flavin-dependent oxidoreductase (luciferase family)